MELEVIEWVAALTHRTSGGRPGAMTSGGTESILMAMLVARARAHERGIESPEIVIAPSAHPAYAKAAHYFGMKIARGTLDDQWRADPQSFARAINDNTAVVVASAFSYPYGVLDPVEEIASLAADAGIGCHVDACIGGFILPFLEVLGRSVPPWDFRVPGVTSMSVDVHKYGYVPKGASVVLHRDDDWLLRQLFTYDQWGSGLYGSLGVAGARSAVPVACAWAALQYLGVEGYAEIVGELMETVRTIQVGLTGDDISIVGDPIGPVFALQSSTIDLYGVADATEERGWYLNRNTEPRGLHLMISPAHRGTADELIADFAECVALGRSSSGAAPRYS